MTIWSFDITTNFRQKDRLIKLPTMLYQRTGTGLHNQTQVKQCLLGMYQRYTGHIKISDSECIGKVTVFFLEHEQSISTMLVIHFTELVFILEHSRTLVLLHWAQNGHRHFKHHHSASSTRYLSVSWHTLGIQHSLESPFDKFKLVLYFFNIYTQPIQHSRYCGFTLGFILAATYLPFHPIDKHVPYL